ncbi:MAG TPA: hypothetical protein VNL73_08145 [Verrucomicrobiae bacterium]|nr:hypothetical protein [Verrucomicrobiae bacterium]
MKKICFLLLLGILGIEEITEAETGFSVGLKGTYGIPLGKFSEVGEPYIIAGQKAARPAFGFGSIVKYRPPFLSKTVAVRGRIEYLQMDDMSGEYVSIAENGDTLGRTDFKFRVIPVSVAIQYSPFPINFNIKPFLGLGIGTYFYSYANVGYNPRSSFSQILERNYTRLGVDFELGSELSLLHCWAVETSFSYNVVFLRRGDDIGVQSNLSALRFFQISTGVLYRI